MVGVRMIVADHVQALGASFLFHANLLARIDQKPVSLRFPSRLIKGQQLLGTLWIVPQVRQRHNFRYFFLVTVGLA